MQVGYVGLLKAINNFDPSYGESLMAYARPCVSGEIKRYFRDKRWQIRVRRQEQELLLEIRAAEEPMTQQLGHTPDDGEIADWLGVTETEVTEARQAHLAFTTCSLDAPLTSEGEPTVLADVIGAEDPAIGQTTNLEAVLTHLTDLSERERRILLLRFYGNLTQTQIGERLGISQMHVCRLLHRALSYLREQLSDEYA